MNILTFVINSKVHKDNTEEKEWMRKRDTTAVAFNEMQNNNVT